MVCPFTPNAGANGACIANQANGGGATQFEAFGNARSLKATRLLYPFTPKSGANGARKRRLVYAFRDDVD